MSRDTKTLVTFVITMIAVWVSNIVYKLDVTFVNGNYLN